MATGWSADQIAWMKVNDPKRLAGGYKASYAGQGTFQNEAQAKAAGANLAPRPKPGSQTGFTPGVAYANKGSQSKGSIPGAALGAAGAGIGGSAAFAATNSVLLGKGLAAASLGLGPVGWALGGAALGYSLLKGKKSNKDFEGTRLTGGAKAWQDKGGTLYDTGGKLPTMEEFTTKGRWLMPEDSYAHDYGRNFSQADAKYYANFQKAVEGAKTPAERAAIMAAHGFGPKKAEKKMEAPKSRSAPAPAPVANEPTPVSAPITDDERAEITPPASGLEDTIKTTPQLLRERRKRSYLTAG